VIDLVNQRALDVMITHRLHEALQPVFTRTRAVMGQRDGLLWQLRDDVIFLQQQGQKLAEWINAKP
jgi:hypothetical protein